MVKRHCQLGQKLNVLNFDNKRKIQTEARALIKNPKRSRDKLDKFKADLEETKARYDAHVRSCKTCGG